MIWQVSPGPDLFCRTVVALTRGITDRGAGASILPQLAPERRPPVSNFGYICAPGPPSRVHRACPIYFLGLSSFRRCAFEALKRAENASVRADFRRLRARATPSESNFGCTRAPGPPSRVHRACPKKKLGPSSFRWCAFEALKTAESALSRNRRNRASLMSV
jgi:hypothetical protein